MVTSLEKWKNGLVDFEEFAADFLSRHGKIEERNRIKAAGTKTACTGRKFAENWKIINCQTTLKKLAWSAPGCSLAGIFFFFFHQSPRKLPFSLILINLLKKFPATPAGSYFRLSFPALRPVFLPLSPFAPLFF